MAEDLIEMTLWVPDEPTLKAILSRAKVNLDSGSPKRDESGNFLRTLFVTAAEAATITALPFRNKVDDTCKRHLAERQQEGSYSDRRQDPEDLEIKP